MSPEAVACVVVLGVVFGVFPAPFCPTLFCALAALVLRLNPAAIQLVNYLVCPLQIGLAAPFVCLGSWLLRTPAAPPPRTPPSGEPPRARLFRRFQRPRLHEAPVR
jgi:hypothetical protein